MHIVHGELRKAPYVKPNCGQDGQSTMFIVELSEMTKDRQTGEKTYANYSAAIFAKSPAQIAYYTTQMVEGNFIVLTSEKLKVDVSPCGKYIKLQMENARLEGAQYIQGAQAQQAAPMQQAPQQAPVQQAPQQQRPPQGQPMGVSQQPKQIAEQAGYNSQQMAMPANSFPQNNPNGQAFDDGDIPFNHPR